MKQNDFDDLNESISVETFEELLERRRLAKNSPILGHIGISKSRSYKRELIRQMLKEKEDGTITIVDPEGEYDEFIKMLKEDGYNVVMRNIDELEQVSDDLMQRKDFKFKSNNWLKMHKKPMRRKPFKRGVEFMLVDEMYRLIDNPPAEEYIKQLYEKCRKYKE